MNVKPKYSNYYSSSTLIKIVCLILISSLLGITSLVVESIELSIIMFSTFFIGIFMAFLWSFHII